MAKRYRRLKGNSAYLPFAARTDLRAGQRRKVGLLWLAGLTALGLAALLLLRQTVMNGGQPTLAEMPAVSGVADTAPTPAAESDALPHRITVQPLAATLDALAAPQNAEETDRATPETAAAPAPQLVAEILPQYRSLYEQNPDMVGWLKMPALEISLPVLCTPGRNEYYLRRGFDRLYSTGGSLFLDERCTLGDGPDEGTPTANWLIYGHNMADGSMLGGITRYREEAFYKENPTFRFDTLYKSRVWQVVAAFDTTLGAEERPYYTFFNADSARDWQDRVDAMLALAHYDTGILPEYGDQLLILSTCGDTSPTTDTRFALLAVAVD